MKERLKVSIKSLLVIVLLLCVVGDCLIACGMLFVTSNVVHVGVQYTVALSHSVTNSQVALTAVVRNDGKAVAGVNVAFYYSLNNGDWSYITSQSTNRGGVAHAKFIISANGAYDFKAIVSVL